MSQADARGLAEYLSKMAADGFQVLTWNGLAFDFDILAEESGAAASCAECAIDHVDMMFHAFCALGYPIGLDKAAQGMGLPGKPPGMSGAKAPATVGARPLPGGSRVRRAGRADHPATRRNLRAAAETPVDHAQGHEELDASHPWLADRAGSAAAAPAGYFMDVQPHGAQWLHRLVANSLGRAIPGRRRCAPALGLATQQRP